MSPPLRAKFRHPVTGLSRPTQRALGTTAEQRPVSPASGEPQGLAGMLDAVWLQSTSQPIPSQMHPADSVPRGHCLSHTGPGSGRGHQATSEALQTVAFCSLGDHGVRGRGPDLGLGEIWVWIQQQFDFGQMPFLFEPVSVSLS